ncbi:MAG TPA: CHAT domain-containing protein, partial [Patescibacteria group bacterium]|nr:CHAT domain-containing protein [Patescibacteria group bacterium]
MIYPLRPQPGFWRTITAWFSTRGAFIGWLVLLMSCPAIASPAPSEPIALVQQGQKAFEAGRFSQAVRSWERAVELYRIRGDTNAEISTSLSLATGWQSLGQHRRAVEILEKALAAANSSGDRSRVTLVKSRLGAALVMSQELQRANELLNESLQAARAESDSGLAAAILNDLGNLLVKSQNYPEAMKAYRESGTLAEQSSNVLLSAQALCNAALSAARSDDNSQADSLSSQALRATERLDDTHAKAFLLLTIGLANRQLISTNGPPAETLLRRAHSAFEQALQIGRQLQDRAIETYALGYLGWLYQADRQTDAALSLTRQAAFTAQEAQMPEALYLWEWQSGRLLRAQGDTDTAIAAFRRAIQTLQPIRNDMSAGYGNAPTQLSFRDSEGPLFYELADLLLQKSKATNDPKLEQQLLLEARDTVESLKTVELEDYFCDECVDVQRVKTRVVENVDKSSAVIYLIPLPDRTEVLVGQSSGLTRFTANVASAKLTDEVREFRRNLETRTTYGYLAQAQSLYDWLIRPIRGLLDRARTQTLVFVSDGALRTIPLAALHDGDHFLIQDFAVAVVPGLSLVEPKRLERREARLLLNGLSKPVQGFAQL